MCDHILVFCYNKTLRLCVNFQLMYRRVLGKRSTQLELVDWNVKCGYQPFYLTPFPVSSSVFNKAGLQETKKAGVWEARNEAKTYSTKRCRTWLEQVIWLSTRTRFRSEARFRSVHKQLGKPLPSHMVPASLPHTISRSQTVEMLTIVLDPTFYWHLFLVCISW